MSKNLLEEMEQYLKLDPNTFKKTVEKEPLNVLRERSIQLEMFIREAKSQPIHQNKLINLSQLLRQTLAQKEQEHFTQKHKLEEKWKTETLKTSLPNIRYASGSAIEHLISGTYTLDVIPWETPASTEIAINNRKVDLDKLIPPQILKNMLDHPFSIIYFTLQPSGIFRKDKLQGLWYDGKDWDRSKNDQYKPRILLAIMKV
jgi:hypothetical protein